MSKEKMKILEMIEQKIISVEDGLKLLESVDREAPEPPEAPKAPQAPKAPRGKVMGFNLKDEMSFDDLESMKGSFKESIDDMIKGLENVFDREIKNSDLNEEVTEMFEDEMTDFKDKVEDAKEEVEDLCSDEDDVDKDAMKAAAEKMKDEMKKLANETEKFGRHMGKMGTKAAALSQGIVKDVMSQIKGAVRSAEFSRKENYGESQGGLEPGSAQSFEVDPIEYLDLRLVATDVYLMTENRDDIEIVSYGKGDQEQSLEIFFDEAEGRLVLAEKKRSSVNFGFVNRKKIEIKLPNTYKKHVSVKTVSGDLFLDYLDLESFKFVSVSGELHADIIYAENGMVKTTSGDALINLYKGDMMFNSISGDCRMAYESLDGDIVLKTISGDVSIDIPKGSEFNVEMKTISGDLECDFPVTFIGQQKRGRIQGQVGSDAHLISATTTSGDIYLKEK